MDNQNFRTSQQEFFNHFSNNTNKMLSFELFKFIEQQNDQEVARLIKEGANVNCELTPLIYATMHYHDAIVEMLLHAKAYKGIKEAVFYAFKNQKAEHFYEVQDNVYQEAIAKKT